MSNSDSIIYGRHIWRFPPTKLEPERTYEIDWGLAIPTGVGTKHDRSSLLRTCKSFFRTVYCTATFNGATRIVAFRRLCTFVKWMIAREIWRFSDLTSTDIVNFLKSRKPRSKEDTTIAKRLIEAYLLLLQRLWDHRHAYSSPLTVNPETLADEVHEITKGRINRPWQAIPEDVSIAFIGEAIEWNERYGSFLVEVLQSVTTAFTAKRVLTKKQRGALSRLVIESFGEREEMKALRCELAFKLSDVKLLARCLTLTIGACVTLLFFLEGFRNSELRSLNIGCLRDGDGPDAPACIHGIAAKKGDTPRSWAAGETVRETVLLLHRIAEAQGGCSKSDGLIRNRVGGGFAENPNRLRARASQMTIDRVLGAFCWMKWRPGRTNYKFHPHRARKSFAQLAVKRDRTMLEPVSEHFGHIWADFTDNRYVGIDYELAELLAQEDRKEVATALLDLLTSKSIAGGASVQLRNLKSNYKGKAGLTQLVDRLIDQGVTIAPCNWGYCVYSQTTSACHGSEKTPNEITRSPDLCSSCHNLQATEKHLSYWSERANREAAFLKRQDLPEQTIFVVRNRLESSMKMVSRIVNSARETIDAKP